MIIKNLLSILGVLLFMMIISSCSPKSQNDCGFVQNIYGQRVSWKQKLPLTLIIHKSIPTELRPAIYRAAKTWESQIGTKVFDITEDSSQLSDQPGRDQKNGIYFLSDWESDRKSEQGRTNVLWAGDEIHEADIRINAANFSYYDQNPKSLIGSYGMVQAQQASADGYSFEALILHEMGHFLGLKHREDQGTVMSANLAAFTNRTQLSSSDQGSISCEYKN
jgi:hypothetical protein